MYNLINTYIRERKPSPEWILTNIDSLTISELLTAYSDVLLVLSNTFLSNLVQIKLKDLPVVDRNVTVSQFLTYNENNTLPTEPLNIPNHSIEATYSDCFMENMDIELVHPLIESDSTKDSKTNIAIRSLDIPTTELFENYVFIVNGLLHRSSYAGKYLHIVDGGRTLLDSNKNLIGMLKLGNLGKVTSKPIECSYIVEDRKAINGSKIFIKANTDDIDLKDKTVMLSIGGYLTTPKDLAFKRIGTNLFSIDFSKIPLIERVYDTIDRVGDKMYECIVGQSSIDESILNVEELYSFDSLRKILSNSRSFFIIIDTPEVSMEYIPTENNKLAGSYISYNEPKLPLITGYGAVSNYVYKKEQDRFVLSNVDYLKPKYIFNTTLYPFKGIYPSTHNVDSSKLPYETHEYCEGRFLRMFKQVYKA